MSTPDPNCPACKGRGWYEGPGSDPNFGPVTEMYPCLICVPVEPMPRWAKLVLSILAALVVALLFGGVR